MKLRCSGRASLAQGICAMHHCKSIDATRGSNEFSNNDGWEREIEKSLIVVNDKKESEGAREVERLGFRRIAT